MSEWNTGVKSDSQALNAHIWTNKAFHLQRQGKTQIRVCAWLSSVITLLKTSL